MSSPINTAILCIAGYGTRFLPATYRQPKEMLPIGRTPIAHLVVKQISEAGIKDFRLITRNGTHATFDYFGRNPNVVNHLKKSGKEELLKEVLEIPEMGRFYSVQQDEQKGDGHALLCGIPETVSEPFLVAFPDYIVRDDERIFVKMIDAYRKYRCPIVAVNQVPMEQVHKYGVVAVNREPGHMTMQITDFVEKPKSPELAPSNLINIGYMIVTPDLISYLRRAQSTVNDGEIRIADALTKMVKDGKKVRAIEVEQGGYDCGQPIGWAEANVDFNLQEDYGEEFLNILFDRVATAMIECPQRAQKFLSTLEARGFDVKNFDARIKKAIASR